MPGVHGAALGHVHVAEVSELGVPFQVGLGQLERVGPADQPGAPATSAMPEHRAIRALSAPTEPGFPGARQAVLIERYVTIKKNGRWTMRNCEAVPCVTSLVITLFRLQGVTRITEETRRNAQHPGRPLQLLAIRPG